jgi:hypothetical protein
VAEICSGMTWNNFSRNLYLATGTPSISLHIQFCPDWQ